MPRSNASIGSSTKLTPSTVILESPILRLGLVVVALMLAFVDGYFMVSPSVSRPLLAQSSLTEMPVLPQHILGTFKGTLPCADCSGLSTEITFLSDVTTATQGTYTLKETYIGKSAPTITLGTWKILQGSSADPKAMVYQLNTVGGMQYYLKVNDSTLRGLDTMRREIDTKQNLTLRKE